jgi:hypothetical protein
MKNPHRPSVVPNLLRALKRKLGPLWWFSSFYLIFARLGDIVNLYIGAFLVPSMIASDDLGAILPFVTMIALASRPISVVLTVALKYISVFSVCEERGRIKALLRDLVLLAFALSLGYLAVLWVFRDAIKLRLKFGDDRILWLLAGLFLVSCCGPIVNIASRGVKKFYRLIISCVLGPLVRLLLILLLLQRLQLLGYLTAQFVSSVVVILFLAWGLREYISKNVRAESYASDLPDMRRYLMNAGLTALLWGLCIFFEPWTIRNFTPRIDSAGYYVAFIFGQIPLGFSMAISLILFPLISERFERGEKTKHMLMQSIVVMLIAGSVVNAGFFFWGRHLMQLRADWRTYAEYAPFIWRLGVVGMLQGVITAYMEHENACRRFLYVKLHVPILVTSMGLLYTLMGWHFFKPWLPLGFWQTVESLVSRDLGFIVNYILAQRLLLTVLVFGDMAWMHIRDKRNST